MPAETLNIVLSDAEIDALEEATSGDLASAITNLALLREGSAHTRRGFDTWHAYVLDRFGDLLRHLDLAVEDRVALVKSMRAATPPVPFGQIADKLGISRGAAHKDAHSSDADVIPIRRPRKAAAAPPVVDPIGHLHKTDQIVILVGKAGEEGLTCFEAEEERGWRHGAASGAWTPVAKQGRIVKTDRKRLGYAVYVLGEG